MRRRWKDLSASSWEGLSELLSPERRHELAGSLAIRGRARNSLDRIRASGWLLVQTAAAASLAWLLATNVLGHEGAFFAPVAAIIALAATRGNGYVRHWR